MAKNEFVEYVIGDQLADIHGMSARPMFGGFGIYREGVIVGIVVDDELYLKVDDTNRGEYEAMGSTPFTYEMKKGKKSTMSYWRIPSDVLESRERLALLVDQAFEINLAKESQKEKKKK